MDKVNGNLSVNNGQAPDNGKSTAKSPDVLKIQTGIWEKLFEYSEEGITYVDNNDRFIYANSTAHELLGLPAGSLIGKSQKEFNNKIQKKCPQPVTSKTQNKTKPTTYRLEIIKSDRKFRTLKIKNYPHFDPGGRYIGSFRYFFDISDQIKVQSELENLKNKQKLLNEQFKEKSFELKQANESHLKKNEKKNKTNNALQECEDRYRNMVESSVNAIIIHDENSIIYLNQRAAKLLGGKSKKVFLGKPLSFILHPESINIDKKRIEKILKRKKHEQISEEKYIRSDGKIIDVKVTGTPVVYNSKAAVLSTVIDITQSKKAEERELLHQLQLIQADKMVSLGTLVSGVAHEINNPNNFIMLNAEIFSEIWDSISPILDQYSKSNDQFFLAGFPYKTAKNKIKKLINGLLEGSKRIKSIVNELRNFARPDALESFQKVDVNKIVNSSVALTQNMINRTTKRFVIKTENELPQIYGSFQRLEQVIINLIQNACQALVEKTSQKDGELLIFTGFDQKNDEVFIKIKDEGIGIPEENLRFITDPFFTTKRTADGTGLGLSVSLRIVRDHGGTLNFKSKINIGTEAEVRLPVIPGIKGGKFD